MFGLDGMQHDVKTGQLPAGGICTGPSPGAGIVDPPCRGGIERAPNDADTRAHSNTPVEIDDVARFHADAAVGGRASDIVLGWSSMNVDTAAEGIPVVTFPSAQPHDAGHNWIVSPGVGFHNFAGGFPAFEHHSLAGSSSDLFGDDVPSQRSPIASPAASQSELRG